MHLHTVTFPTGQTFNVTSIIGIIFILSLPLVYFPLEPDNNTLRMSQLVTFTRYDKICYEVFPTTESAFGELNSIDELG